MKGLGAVPCSNLRYPLSRFRFLPIYLGDTAPFDAGLQLLTNPGISTAEIDGAEALWEQQLRVRAEIK